MDNRMKLKEYFDSSFSRFESGIPFKLYKEFENNISNLQYEDVEYRYGGRYEVAVDALKIAKCIYSRNVDLFKLFRNWYTENYEDTIRRTIRRYQNSSLGGYYANGIPHMMNKIRVLIKEWESSLLANGLIEIDFDSVG
jgi:hypothetical protein